MPAVTIENLSKTFPPAFPRLKKFFGMQIGASVEALKNVSFEIAENEIFGLIGKNGAGKTTLTKIIATLVQPTSGRVSVKNFDSVRDEVKVRSLIGLATAEERSFYWRLTAEQNLLFFARLYGMQDARARGKIKELFARLDLQELARRRFSELSTGNKQRLAVARALLASPPILLLDEPTRSLDPLAADKMREQIKSLENVSILLTSHNLAEIEELCTRVAIISKGEIRVVDKPENLRRTHRQTQSVMIRFNNLAENAACEILRNVLPEFSLDAEKDFLELNFTRDADDDSIGRTVSILSQSGAKILDFEMEKATLLDVLESFE